MPAFRPSLAAAALLITLPGPRPPRAGLPPDAPAAAPPLSATAPAAPPGPSEPAASPSSPAAIPGCGEEGADGALDLDAGPLGAKQKVARTNVMNARFDGGFGFYPLRAKADPGPASDGPLRLTLSGPERIKPEPLKKDQPLRLSLRFRNVTARPLTILRPNDGSLEHMREPHYDLFLRDEGSGRVYRYAFVGGRCGNVNPTRPEDHVELAPGSERGSNGQFALPADPEFLYLGLSIEPGGG